ncbi:unnamed protein product, partial [Didymodactylos carnosus]
NQKLCILITDAPPHGLGCADDNYPDGCPCKLDPWYIAEEFERRDITLLVIGIEPEMTPYKGFYYALANKTGGTYIPFENANILPKIINGSSQELSIHQMLRHMLADDDFEMDTQYKFDLIKDHVQHISKHCRNLSDIRSFYGYKPSSFHTTSSDPSFQISSNNYEDNTNDKDGLILSKKFRLSSGSMEDDGYRSRLTTTNSIDSYVSEIGSYCDLSNYKTDMKKTASLTTLNGYVDCDFTEQSTYEDDCF